jgi:hypothetical protein
MADIFADGNTRVAFVPTIANIASPTTTELNAVGSLLLHSTMTADGLEGYEATTADVDTTALDSTFDTVNIGRDSYSDTLVRLKKQTVGADTIRTTLVRGTTGYIVIRRGITASTAWASTQQVEVYPIICGRRKENKPEKNTVMRYEVPTKIYIAPNPDAVIA